MAERIVGYSFHMEHSPSPERISPTPTSLRIASQMCSLSTAYEQSYDRRVRYTDHLW